jgi:hypothetical protein
VTAAVTAFAPASLGAAIGYVFAAAAGLAGYEPGHTRDPAAMAEAFDQLAPMAAHLAGQAAHTAPAAPVDSPRPGKNSTAPPSRDRRRELARRAGNRR